MKKIFKLEGLHCESCAKIIILELADKVNSISVDYKNGSAVIDFDKSRISEKKIIECIIKLGYEVASWKNE